MLVATNTLVNDGDDLNPVDHPFQPSSAPADTGPTSQSVPPSEDMIIRATQANHGDLDWSYTLRCVRHWSPSALLTHLSSLAFSVPPRASNPTFSPFVAITFASQDGIDPPEEIVTLPQAYRLPLLIVAKYLWDKVHLALSSGHEEWNAQKANIFHISRLCDNLMTSARVKAGKGGMEKSWRCFTFERFLARFYKHWPQNDPASNEAFWKEHGAKEYNRDVLKYDWKRWCVRVQNSIRLTEQEINMGIDAAQFRKTLVFHPQVPAWTLDGKTLSFITSEEGPAWSSVSELTDLDIEEDVEEVKPLIHLIGNNENDSRTVAPANPTPESLATEYSLSAERLMLSIHRPHKNDNSGLSSTPVLPRKVADRARLSTLRQSARPPVYSPSIPVPNSPNLQTPETGLSQSVPSTIQTRVQSSTPKLPRVVVRIKRRATQVTETEGSAQRSGWSLNRPSSSKVADPMRLASSPIKRVSRSSLRKRQMEDDTARESKRRRIDGFEAGKGTEDTIQTSSQQAPPSSPTSSEINIHAYSHPVQPLMMSERGVEVSVQTTPMAICIEQGTQADNLGSDRDLICDSPTTKRTTSDVAIQADQDTLRDDSSARRDQMSNGCTAEMQNNLSTAVDNLVSSRLLLLTQALKQSSQTASTSGSGANASSPSSSGSSALPSTRGTSGMDGHFVNALFDDLRLLREEAHAREQRTKEEMRAMRQLHNAEVDSLRRRLAYLESQSHEQVARDYDTTTTTTTRRPDGEWGNRTRYSGDNHNTRTTTMMLPPRFGEKHITNHFRDDDVLGSSFGARPIRSSDRPPIPSPSNGTNGFSGSYFSTMMRSGTNDVEEDSPLPSKAQRKPHIIGLSRSSVV